MYQRKNKADTQEAGMCRDCIYMYDPHELDVHYLPFMCHCNNINADPKRSYFLNKRCELGKYIKKQ